MGFPAIPLALFVSAIHLIASQEHPSLPPYVNDILEEVTEKSPKHDPEPELSKL